MKFAECFDSSMPKLKMDREAVIEGTAIGLQSPVSARNPRLWRLAKVTLRASRRLFAGAPIAQSVRASC